MGFLHAGKMISFTEKAANKVLSIMQEQKVSDDTVVRVGVRGGGCSGFTYTVDFDSKKGKFDLEFESFGPVSYTHLTLPTTPYV